MKPETWLAIDDSFKAYPFLKAEAAGDDQIDAASTTIGLVFPADYREFLRRYGAGIVGPYPVFGVRAVEEMGNDWSVVEMNRRFRADRWPGVNDWLVVSADHAGNPFGIDQRGMVWVSDHDFRRIAPIADDFEDFLRKRCLKL